MYKENKLYFCLLHVTKKKNQDFLLKLTLSNKEMRKYLYLSLKDKPKVKIQKVNQKHTTICFTKSILQI